MVALLWSHAVDHASLANSLESEPALLEHLPPGALGLGGGGAFGSPLAPFSQAPAKQLPPGRRAVGGGGRGEEGWGGEARGLWRRACAGRLPRSPRTRGAPRATPTGRRQRSPSSAPQGPAGGPPHQPARRAPRAPPAPPGPWPPAPPRPPPPPPCRPRGRGEPRAPARPPPPSPPGLEAWPPKGLHVPRGGRGRRAKRPGAGRGRRAQAPTEKAAPRRRARRNPRRARPRGARGGSRGKSAGGGAGRAQQRRQGPQGHRLSFPQEGAGLELEARLRALPGRAAHLRGGQSRSSAGADLGAPLGAGPDNPEDVRVRSGAPRGLGPGEEGLVELCLIFLNIQIFVVTLALSKCSVFLLKMRALLNVRAIFATRPVFHLLFPLPRVALTNGKRAQDEGTWDKS